VLLAFGVSGAGIAGALDASRPVFITLTVGFLAAAFYLTFTYRPRRKAAPASGDCCATAHDCCATSSPTSKRRFNMMTLNKVMLWVVTVIAVAFLFFPSYVKFFLKGSGGGSGEPDTNNLLVRTTTFSVQGMSCEGCAAVVEKTVQGVPGVLSVKVDYDRKRMVVTSEASCPAPAEAVIDAIQGAGYRATVVKADSAGTGTAQTGDPSSGDCCEQPALSEKAKMKAKQIDPERQIVFTVKGLTCPAVKGIGCGHRLAPVLERVDKIDGVEASAANYTGTLLRISVKAEANREKVTAAVRQVLAENNPVALAGDALKKTALQKEQWRETRRVGELSAIEFRALALYRIMTFAQAEKLNKETTDKLVKMAQDQWDRLAQEAKKANATRPEDWGNRFKQAIPEFLSRAKEVLGDEPVGRFKKALLTPCRNEDRPEAPPAQ
jgi:copper chaperone CopZ